MSKGLCSVTNLTIVGLNLEIDALFIIDEKEKRVKGKQEAAYVQLLGREKNCNLIKTDTYSRKYGNKSYIGALKLFDNKHADVLLNFQPFDFQTDVGENSYPLKTENIVTTHSINLNEMVKSNLDILQMISVDYLYFVLHVITVILFLFLTVCFLKFKKRSDHRISERFIENFMKASFMRGAIDRTFLSTCILLCLIRFLNSNSKNFITNSFKTSQVLIDTDRILNNVKKLDESDRYICWLEEDTLRYIFPVLPKDTFLYKLLYKKNHSDGCMVHKELNEKTIESIKKFHRNGFILTDHVNSQFFINSLLKFFKFTYWISKNAIFENILTLYIRKSLSKDLKAKIKELSQLYLEFGICLKMESLIVFLSSQISEVKTELFIFESLNRIYEENIKLVPYNIHSFRRIFLYLIFSQLAIIIVSIINLAFKYKCFFYKKYCCSKLALMRIWSAVKLKCCRLFKKINRVEDCG